MKACVVCKNIVSDSIEIIGPFKTIEEAVEWADKMSHENSSWNYQGQKMHGPM